MHHDDPNPMMIPAGSTVAIAPTSSKVGIVTATLNGRMVWVFLRDLIDAGRIEADGNFGQSGE